jgi:hypothetical protein
MGASTRSVRGIASGTPSPPGRWTPTRLVGFRFGVVYLVLFCLATQISASMIPNLWLPYRGLGRVSPMRDITEWTAQSVFGVTSPVTPSNGEPLFFWVQTTWILVVALVATIVWSVADRGRQNYTRQYAWLSFFVRLALASSLIEYGMTKVIPTQFPTPPLTALVTPVGDLTLSALLWTSMGAAQPYEIFTGCIETLAGVLLLIPRTALLGATVGLAALVQVFALNMSYDIGLKLVTLHLIAMTALVLAPDFPRLVDFFVRSRAATPAPRPEPAVTARGQRLLRGAQVAFGVFLLAMYLYINWSFWQVAGGGRPRSALYGIWNVDELAVDGQIRPAVLNDYDRRWRRIIFDTPDTVSVQRTDDSLATYDASLDSARGLLTLTKRDSRQWAAHFSIMRESEDSLAIEGQMDGHRIDAQLRRVSFDAFPLLNSTFRWIRPHDDP